ncbi:MAG: hypothetical protein ACWGQW_10700 [bacterium]
MKTERIPVYLTTEQKELLEQASNSVGMPLATFMRGVALKEAMEIKRTSMSIATPKDQTTTYYPPEPHIEGITGAYASGTGIWHFFNRDQDEDTWQATVHSGSRPLMPWEKDR